MKRWNAAGWLAEVKLLKKVDLTTLIQPSTSPSPTTVTSVRATTLEHSLAKGSESSVVLKLKY